MSVSTYFVSEAAVRHLKQSAQQRVSGISSSHLSESIAAALGFKTHAALRTALSGVATTRAQKPSNAKMVQRLRQLGYSSVPDDLRLLPELEHSYSPFQNFPLRKKRGVRWLAWRNLLVTAINAGLEQRLFGLSPGENWWHGAATESQRCELDTYSFVVDGEIPAVASIDAISGDELVIHTVLNPRKPECIPDRFSGLTDGDAFAFCWIERRLGAWIQDGGEDFSCKRTMQARLAGLTIEPIGYSDQGSFIM